MSHPSTQLPMSFWLCLLAICISSTIIHAQDDDDDDPQFLHGIVEKTVVGDGHVSRRISQSVSFAQDLNHKRLESKTWVGRVEARKSGAYQFEAFSEGDLVMKIGEKTVLRESSQNAIWGTAKPIELKYGWHPVRVQFKPTSKSSRFSLFWSGPGFQTEPVRAFFHSPEATVETSLSDGYSAVRALGCAACHSFNADISSLQAPSIENLNGNISTDWLVSFLGERHHATGPRSAKLKLTKDEIAAVVKFLVPKSDREKRKGTKNDTNRLDSSDSKRGDSERGENLFTTVGCLACHTANGLGTSSLVSGGDLSAIADKRSYEFFVAWLKDPARLNRNHRMPVFELSGDERHNLAAYLATRSAGVKPSEIDLANADAKHGAAVVRKRCNVCHTDGSENGGTVSSKRSKIDAESIWKRSCISEANPAINQPKFVVKKEMRTAIRQFISSPSDLPIEHGAIVMRERGCLACHARGHAPGIQDVAKRIVEEFPELQDRLAVMDPPSLNSVGDKLTAEALQTVLERRAGNRRPWLAIRMPKFAMSESEANAIHRYLKLQDHIPDRKVEAESRAPISHARLRSAGSRLVTSDGFGCTSCHQIGNVAPEKAPAHLKGPDLTLAGERMRRSWFERWLRNPARIVPRVEMPSIQHPVGGVLNGNLDDQIAAVWHVLNERGFNPPDPNPLRVVRHNGIIDGVPARPHVVTDVLFDSGRKLIKPFGIGLANRHNLLFDLESGSLAAWSIGDLARQRTKGKTWFWDWAGAEILGSTSLQAEFEARVNDEWLTAKNVGQFVTEIEHLEYEQAGGIKFVHRLHFDGSPETNNSRSELTVQQTISLNPAIKSGFRRTVSIKNRANRRVRFRPVPPGHRSTKNQSDGHQKIVVSRDGVVATIELKTQEATFEDGWIEFPSTGENSVIELTYSTNLEPDFFAPSDIEPPRDDVTELDVAPGFQTVRLPLPDEFMPTGFAWAKNGDLYVTSLKGRVWLAHDSDGDAIEDTLQVFSHELAAPYGVAVNDDANQKFSIDVINKYGLLRLYDYDRDGTSDATRTMASGWGHTDDYHDWTVGLPRDNAGNYYVSIACRQDERADAASRLRGSVVKLTPSSSESERFSLHEVSRGHRFAMGIAMSKDEEIFVTDNQGNYNPFNELNHVRQNGHFGFFNKHESKDSPKFRFLRSALEIPHPWTRSVNGICFLDSPASNRGERSTFGPFEGHLVGCEYDTRRLVRMSLQKVGADWQGAIYPLTDANGSDSLMGPVVCSVSPRGELYVGEMRDSGWGGGNNRGAISRLKMDLKSLPAGIAEVAADSNGFRIQFTRPVNAELARDKNAYNIASVKRESTPAYGGDDKDRRIEKIRTLQLAKDRRSVKIELERMRAGYVYEFRLDRLVPDGKAFHPSEAYYTLHRVPK